MLKIGEFSKVSQVSIKTLRYYDELGLFSPDWVDRYTGYRYYTLQQLPRLNRILALRELGFSLVQIERLLQEDLTVEELRRLMMLRQAEVEQQVRAEQARLAQVAARLRLIEQEGRQPRYEVMVKQVPPLLVAGIRDTISGDEDLHALSDELRRSVAGWGIAPGPLTPFTVIYYDAEYLDRGADVEVALPIQIPLRQQARVAVHELPAIDSAACVVHQGSHGQLSSAYQALTAWSQINGYRAGPQSREIYLQGFEPDAMDGFVTELQLAILPVSTITTKDKEESIMEPKIVNKAAFTVVGLPFTGFISSGPYENSNQNNEIGKVWDELNARYQEIKNLSGPAYGLCFAMPNDKEPWYIAGMEVSQAADLPAGMMSMSVPAQRYAVFPCTLSTISQTYRYITEEWQPRSPYQHANGPDFECYDEEFNGDDPKQMPLSVYWPIQ